MCCTSSSTGRYYYCPIKKNVPYGYEVRYHCTAPLLYLVRVILVHAMCTAHFIPYCTEQWTCNRQKKTEKCSFPAAPFFYLHFLSSQWETFILHIYQSKKYLFYLTRNQLQNFRSLCDRHSGAGKNREKSISRNSYPKKGTLNSSKA